MIFSTGNWWPEQSKFVARTWLILAVTLLTCVWFLSLDARHLLSPDEGRYAEIAREMFLSGDWVTVRYNDLKYFEKPPFHLWMTVLAYHAFGIGEWQARLWGALSSAFAIGMVMLAAQRWYGPRVGLLTGLVLLAAPNWNLGSHFNSLDISVSAALACALACTLIAQHPQASLTERRRWMMFAWAAIGIAVLTKGLIGIVLPGLSLVAYTAWSRDLRIWRRLHIIGGAALMLAMTMPWFWLIAQRNPEFLRFFFIHEHFQRFTSTVHRRSGPVWYFIPQLILGFLPWIGLGSAMVVLVRKEVQAEGLRPVLLLAAWTVSIFFFFSLSGSKLPGYILPIMPALALLAALALNNLSALAWKRQLIGALVVSLILAVAPALVARLATDNTPNELYRAYSVWLCAASLTLVAGVLLARRLETRGHRAASMSAYAIAMFLATTLGLMGHETLGRSNSGIDLVPAIQRVLKPDMPIYAVQRLDHTLPFYLQHSFVMVEAPDELEFGTQQEPEKWLPTMDAFRERWRSGPHALAVMAPLTFETLRDSGLAMSTVASDSRRIVVANFEITPP